MGTALTLIPFFSAATAIAGGLCGAASALLSHIPVEDGVIGGVVAGGSAGTLFGLFAAWLCHRARQISTPFLASAAIIVAGIGMGLFAAGIRATIEAGPEATVGGIVRFATQGELVVWTIGAIGLAMLIRPQPPS